MKRLAPRGSHSPQGAELSSLIGGTCQKPHRGQLALGGTRHVPAWLLAELTAAALPHLLPGSLGPVCACQSLGDGQAGPARCPRCWDSVRTQLRAWGALQGAEGTAIRPPRPSGSLTNASQPGLTLTHHELWFCLCVFGNISLFTDLSQTLSLPVAFLQWTLPHPCPSSLPSHGDSPKGQRRTLLLCLLPSESD